MSATNEESPNTNPLDALYALSRRQSERSEPPRLATINDAPSFPRAPRIESRTEPLRPLTSPGDRLESAMSEFVRRQIKPEAAPEPVDFQPERRRRSLMATAIGVAAAVAIASVVAMTFVTMFPREKSALQAFASATHQTEDASKADYRALMAPDGGGKGFTHEQSERLLQQFVQWRQKAALTDKP